MESGFLVPTPGAQLKPNVVYRLRTAPTGRRFNVKLRVPDDESLARIQVLAALREQLVKNSRQVALAKRLEKQLSDPSGPSLVRGDTVSVGGRQNYR